MILEKSDFVGKPFHKEDRRIIEMFFTLIQQPMHGIVSLLGLLVNLRPDVAPYLIFAFFSMAAGSVPPTQ